MPKMNRRNFIRNSSFAGIGSTFLGKKIFTAPEILTKSKTTINTSKGELIFRPFFVQKGKGPHIYNLVWATDQNWDTFHSNINLADGKIIISDTEGVDKFGINARWNVEGFGYTNITADNGGYFYELPPNGKLKELNLNFEFCKSRVERNRRRLNLHKKNGWIPSKEVDFFINLSEEFYEKAKKIESNGEKCAQFAQRGLMYALWASEKLELDKAKYEILKRGYRKDFFHGCDARGFYQMYQDSFMPLFTDLFNYANITYVTKGDGIISDFEPKEGDNQFAIRDVLFNKMKNVNVTCEGRLLFWFHDCCTPDWLKKKSYPELLKYVEKHAREVITHYGSDMYAWEMMNELHDWANELHLNNEQTIELTKLACDVAKDSAPSVKRTINNCCPRAEYIQMKQYSDGPAKYHQRTPYQFIRDCVNAGVEFDIIAQQMYYPYCDLQDSIMLIERYEEFKMPVQISEIGVSGGITNDTIKLGTSKMPEEPYLWHRYWDEETQADWLESIYTLIYSKPYIEGAHWFDFVDPYSYMENGGLLRSPQGEKKEAYLRFQKMEKEWKEI
ncbi:MAG: endo-1,4-beta-xylanase [Ignavibacteriaceae bacterium]